MIAVMGIARNLVHNATPLVALKNVTAAFLSKPLPVLSDEEVTELLGHLHAFVIAQADIPETPIEPASEAIMLIGLIGTTEALKMLVSLAKQPKIHASKEYMHFITHAQREIDERGGKALRLVNE